MSVANAPSSVREGEEIELRLRIDPAPGAQVRSVVFVEDSELGTRGAEPFTFGPSRVTTTVSHTPMDTDTVTTDRTVRFIIAERLGRPDYVPGTPDEITVDVIDVP